MLLEDVNPIHSKFSIGNYTYKLEDIEYDHREEYNTEAQDHIVIGVYDSGDLKTGEFVVYYDVYGHGIEFSDSETGYPNTLERIRRRGDSNKVSRNVRKTISSIQK